MHRSLGDLALARADAARAAEHYRKAIDVYGMVRPQDDGDLNLTTSSSPAPSSPIRRSPPLIAPPPPAGEAALTMLDRLGPGWAAERDAFRTWLKDHPHG